MFPSVFASVLLDACELDLISTCFNMDVCHKDVPVFFVFSGAASIGCITYHAFIFVKTIGEIQRYICLVPWYISAVTFIVTVLIYDINP